MPSLIYRNPDLDEPNARLLADPGQINENFEDIARLLNGNLGSENILNGSIAPTSLAAGRSIHTMTFTLNTGVTWPDGGYLFDARFPLKVVGVAVGYATTSTPFSASLLSNGTAVLTITAPSSPAQAHYFMDAIDSSVALDGTIGLTITAGSAKNLTLYVTLAHSA